MAPKIAPGKSQNLALVPVDYTTQIAYSEITGGRSTLTVLPGQWYTLEFVGAQETPVCRSPANQFVPFPKLDRVAYYSVSGDLFYVEDGKNHFLSHDYQTRFVHLDLKGKQWKLVVHCFETPRPNGGRVFFEINSLRDKLELTVSKDTDRRWVNGQWGKWRGDLVRIASDPRGELADQCMIPSKQACDSKRNKLQVKSEDGKDYFQEFSASAIPTLLMMARWCRTLGNDQKANARNMVEALVRAGVSHVRVYI